MRKERLLIGEGFAAAGRLATLLLRARSDKPKGEFRNLRCSLTVVKLRAKEEY